MIEVTLYLNDPEEISMFSDFSHTLAAYRARKYSGSQIEVRTPAGEAIEQGLKEAVAISKGELEASRIAAIATEARAQYPGYAGESVVTQAQLEEALKAYGRAKGFPAARALLDEYTKGKLGDVPAEKHAELYAKLTA